MEKQSAGIFILQRITFISVYKVHNNKLTFFMITLSSDDIN